jgi:hypothetical protein
MFRLQANVDLPWTMELTGTFNWQSGRPYARLGRVSSDFLEQGAKIVVLEPASDDRRLPSTMLLDLALGKRWKIGDVTLKTDLQVLNVLNEDANQFWETLVLLPGERYTPDTYVYPRRAMIRIGIEF